MVGICSSKGMKDPGRVYIMDNSERKQAKRVRQEEAGFAYSEAKATSRGLLTLGRDAV
jgi:hypothetical protein